MSDTLLNRLITQLNSLVPFISIANQEIFNLVVEKYSDWTSPGQKSTLPSTFSIYKEQIIHGAFLLGYSYSESFLADLIRLVYHYHPELLPKNKEIKYGDFISHNTYEALLDFIIEKEITDLFFAGIEKIGRYIKEKFNLPWPDDNKEIVKASYLRNCIIHNMGVADARLSFVSEYNDGDRIHLTAAEVHQFGLIMRKLSRRLYLDAEKRHLNRLKK